MKMAQPNKAAVKKPPVLSIPAKLGDNKETLLAKTVLEPSVSNAQALTEIVSASTQDGDELTLPGLVDALRQQCEATAGGSLERGEAMLTAQAHTLDALFMQLVQRTALNFGQHMVAADTYMRLALKAQSQCRTTWESIAEIKNPRAVAFVKQANIANGPQQVNNGVPDARAGKTENEQSKLSGASIELPAITGTQTITSGTDQALEAVGTINGAEVH
jgi:hypothetical protein